MLQNIHIKNFRCFRELSLNLRPLNVLIGQNDTGKTSFLAAIDRIFQGSETLKPIERWRLSTQNSVLLSCRTSEGVVALDEAEAKASNTNAMNTLIHNEYRALYSPVPRFQLPATGVVMTSPGLTDADGPRLPDRDGAGIAGLLDYYNRRDRRRLTAVVDTLRSLAPGIEDLTIGSPQSSHRRVDFVLQGGLEIDGNEVSAGVRMLLFFITLAYHPTPPRVILLEEPETGVHPSRLADVVKLLRSLSNGELGSQAAQVILTTHSPYLLDCVDLDTDQVLVFRREEDGSRTAEPADSERLKGFLDEFMLGEVWFNRGEEGLVARR